MDAVSLHGGSDAEPGVGARRAARRPRPQASLTSDRAAAPPPGYSGAAGRRGAAAGGGPAPGVTPRTCFPLSSHPPAPKPAAGAGARHGFRSCILGRRAAALKREQWMKFQLSFWQLRDALLDSSFRLVIRWHRVEVSRVAARAFCKLKLSAAGRWESRLAGSCCHGGGLAHER